MKVIRFIIPLLVVAVFCSACSATKQAKAQNNKAKEATKTSTIKKEEGWLTLEEDNYRVNYPAGWEKDTSGKMGTIFIFLSPLSDSTDVFRENVNLMMGDLNGVSMSFDEFTTLSTLNKSY